MTAPTRADADAQTRRRRCAYADTHTCHANKKRGEETDHDLPANPPSASSPALHHRHHYYHQPQHKHHTTYYTTLFSFAADSDISAKLDGALQTAVERMEARLKVMESAVTDMIERAQQLQKFAETMPAVAGGAQN